MRINSLVDMTPVQVGYVVGAVAFAAVAVYFPDDFVVSFWMLGALVLLYLGPMGLATVLTLGVALYAVILVLRDAGPLVVIVVAGAIAAGNVLIVRRWQGNRARYSTRVDRLTQSETRNRALGFIVFGYAGCAFIVLCYVAGFAVLDGLTSRSFSWRVMGYETPNVSSDYLAFSTVVIWLNGLGVALAGLAAWVFYGIKRKPLLRLAVIDLAVMLAFIASISLARVLWSVN
ncbi:MAG: hypothetical protein ACOH14_11775 [Rhodoglobus sp.]